MTAIDTQPSFWKQPYPSQRMPVMGNNMVATSQPLAAQAGLNMLYKGGNAVDAALAAAICLTVVEPTCCGIGSDAFALIWDGEKLHGINGSGRSPAAWNLDYFSKYKEMPTHGWDTVTVPGAVDLWIRLSERFGNLPFKDLFTPAIAYARKGFYVTPVIGQRWQDAEPDYKAFPPFARTFLPQGRAPRIGERFACPEQSRTLEEIAATIGESFYRGELADKIIAHAKAESGGMRRNDLRRHTAQWVTPISMAYRGVHLHELPPNTQGIAALVALGILGHFDLSSIPPDSADSLHLQIEAMKIGLDTAQRHVADTDAMRVNTDTLLDADRLKSLADHIDPDRAASTPIALGSDGGTVYLATADANGVMVSFIQSNFTGFGSGVVVPGTGISLQNRGRGFNLERGHPNCVAGGKRPYHTIIPAFVTHKGQPLLSFGVMGGHMQPQGHVQMMVRLFDYGQNPQAAADAPRWQVCEDGQIALEKGFAPEVIRGLQNRGHRLLDGDPYWGYGGAQLILKRDTGYLGASDPRKDGHAATY